MSVTIRNLVQDGEVWLSASDVVAALRDRSERWDQMALVPGEEPEEQRRTACWAASAALARSADEIDLACIARVNA